MLDQRLVFLDLETTGANPVYDRVTEVGLVEVDGGHRVGEWSTLVNPEESIPPAIQALTGITNQMAALAPRFAEIADELFARLDGRTLVAHNARFDYGFLKNEFRRAGRRYSTPVLCTVKLSRRLFPDAKRHNLDALIARHGLACAERHRALGDARVLWELVQAWGGDRGPEAIRDAARALLAAPSVPPGLSAGVIDQLPESPGVYLFFGENDVALYVGKSINLRARVMGHFAGDHRDGKDMKIAQQVQRVDWIETSGELGALIEEARLVKRLAPVYNRRLRRTIELCSWHWVAQRPADAPRLVTARDLDFSQFGDLYGLFRSRAAAIEALRELATAHGLCPLLLGLEQGRAPCFAHQIERCRGACVGKESAELHALRLGQALVRLRMKPWPFSGRVGVREHGGARDELIVLDRWCYLGTVRSDGELRELDASRAQAAFDLDTYRILTRFFGSQRRDYTVVELKT